MVFSVKFALIGHQFCLCFLYVPQQFGYKEIIAERFYLSGTYCTQCGELIVYKYLAPFHGILWKICSHCTKYLFCLIGQQFYTKFISWKPHMVFKSTQMFSYFLWYSLKTNLLLCGFGFGLCTSFFSQKADTQLLLTMHVTGNKTVW